MNKPNGPEPKVGDYIYVPTRGFISHGEDDTKGGLATISKVINSISAGNPTWFISVKELPGVSFNYPMLLEQQDELKKKFVDDTARPDPDFHDYGA